MRNMGSTKLFLGECSNINRPSCVIDECYDFWKIRIQMFLESHGVEVWNTVIEETFIHTTIVEGGEEPNPKDEWNEDDKNKILYDKKAKNILASALNGWIL